MATLSGGLRRVLLTTAIVAPKAGLLRDGYAPAISFSRKQLHSSNTPLQRAPSTPPNPAAGVTATSSGLGIIDSMAQKIREPNLQRHIVRIAEAKICTWSVRDRQHI